MRNAKEDKVPSEFSRWVAVKGIIPNYRKLQAGIRSHLREFICTSKCLEQLGIRREQQPRGNTISLAPYAAKLENAASIGIRIVVV